MTLGATQKIVRESLIASAAISRRLLWSHNQIAYMFPLTKAAVDALSDQDEERLDAYLHRFNSLLSMIQDHLFKGIALLEQEDISKKSNRDKTNLMEKLGVIGSASGFTTIAELRNKLSHHYPNEAEKQTERLNDVHLKATELNETFWSIVDYTIDKSLIPGLEKDIPPPSAATQDHGSEQNSPEPW